LLREMN